MAPGVVYWGIVLRDTVGDADYAGRLVGSAGEGAFVSSICWVGVGGVDAWGVACYPVCCVRAVGTIESVEKRVEATVRESFNEIVDLIQGDGLWL